MSHIEEEDEVSRLVLKGFYVQNFSRPVDMNAEPTNGSEYVRRARLEAESMNLIMKYESESSIEDPEKELFAWGRIEAKRFSDLALKFRNDKSSLKKKFPQLLDFPQEDKDWSLFCLGSELCKKLYPDFQTKHTDKGHDPVLSIILHLEKKDVKFLLQCLFSWYESIGLVNDIGKWLYAVLISVEKPLDRDFENILMSFFKELKKDVKCHSKSRKKRSVLLTGILNKYFLINCKKHEDFLYLFFQPDSSSSSSS